MSEIKNNIIQRVLPIFLERGLKISMDEIAQSLSISKRTIYENFENKKDLIVQCLDYMMEDGDIKAKLYMRENCNPIEELFPILHENVRKIYTYRFRLIEELKRDYPVFYEEYLDKHREKYFSQIKGVIERGKAQGLFLEEANADIISFFFPKITSLITNESHGISENYTMKEIFSSIMVPFMRGMLTQEGILIFNQLIERCIAFKEKQHE